MPEKPAVGLILLRAEWFNSVVALPELAGGLRLDQAEIESWLGESFSTAGVWAIDSPESLARAESQIPGTSADLFLLAFQVWAEDFYLAPLVKAIGGRPLAVWAYQPWQTPPRPLSFTGVLRGSGLVGTFEGLGTLRNLGLNPLFSSGGPGNARLLRDLQAFARAGKACRSLRKARIGLLPGRNEQMQSTFVDEFRLLSQIGPALVPLSVADLQREVERVPREDLENFLAELRREFRIDSVGEETLAHTARCSLALANLAARRVLDVISLNDVHPELHEALGLRPCLYPGLYHEKGILAGLEADVGAAIALLAQAVFSAGPLFFAEFWYWDEAENVIVGGHAGIADPDAALPGTAWISKDYEYAQSDRFPGAHMQFAAKPGRVTLLQMRGTPTGWQVIAASGEALETTPRLEGYPHAAVRLDVPVVQFLSRVAGVGSTQHWIMAYGDTLPEIRAWCQLLGLPLEEISSEHVIG